MSKRTIAVCAVLAVTLLAPGPNNAAGATPLSASAPARSGAHAVSEVEATRTQTPQVGSVGAASAGSPVASSLAATLSAATLTPAQAVAQANSQAAANGINTYISVTNSSTGAVVAQTGNVGTQVASESVFKLMTAAYYLVIVGGYQNQSQSVLNQLSYMIRYSDDQTENDYFTSAAVPTIAARYGMGSTINATDRVGHWGAARITARDMTTFLYRAFRDPQVGPWLKPVMAQVAPVGSDGFNQAFGMNSLSGTHGSKQGWGNDQFWTPASNVINSVGYTDRYYVAILQNSYSFPDPARATSTFAARTIQASRVGVSAPPPPPAPVAARDGDFVSAPAVPGIFRLAGGAPVYVSNWATFGGAQPVKKLTTAQWNALPKVPADGTFLTAGSSGAVYRVAGGAPIYVSNWSHFGGRKSTIKVDAAAVSHAGKAGVWAHLRAVPADGTYLSATGTGAVYRVAGGAPLYITSWAPLGGVKKTVVVDAAAISHGSQPGVWSHLRYYPANGTFLEGQPGHRAYLVNGGRASYVSSWAPYGGPRPRVTITQDTITKAGTGGYFVHLRR